MTSLTDKSGQNPVAIIHNNILVLPGGEVIGIILGHCVFDKKGSVTAKYFTHTLYTLEGFVLAKDFENNTPPIINIPQILEEAWKMIVAIKDHNCPRLDPRDKWAVVSIAEHFATTPGKP